MKMIFVANGRFYIELPDGTKTRNSPYDMVLFFEFNNSQYMAHSQYYGEERCFKLTPEHLTAVIDRT